MNMIKDLWSGRTAAVSETSRRRLPSFKIVAIFQVGRCCDWSPTQSRSILYSITFPQ
jgi:hypothetical protein